MSTSVSAEPVRRTIAPITFPRGYDGSDILRPLRHSAVLEADWTEAGAQRRRRETYDSLLHFAILYLADYFTDQETGRMSFAEGHMDMCRRVNALIEPRRPDGSPHRWALAAPRRYGKSTLVTFAAPVFLLAHGHRRFFAMFSATQRLAVTNHLLRIKQLLQGRNRSSALLLHDYPHLALQPGGGAARMSLLGGQTIAAGGLLDNNLGLVAGEDRPDDMRFDDMLGGAAATNPTNVKTAKTIITDNLLPMGAGHSAVSLSGTAFIEGDLMDDVVRQARGERPRSADRGAWLTGNGFECKYYRPDWPQRWTKRQLAEAWAASPLTYARQMEPHLLSVAQESTHFTDELFASRRWGTYTATQRVIFTDHAVSVGKGADRTAICVLAKFGHRVIVEWVESGRYDENKLMARVHELAGQFGAGQVRPSVLGWERVQGGAMLPNTLVRAFSLPMGMRMVQFGVNKPKATRIEHLHGQYEAALMWHARELSKYEAQAVAWRPGASGAGVDDMLDCVAAGGRFLLDGDAGDKHL